MMTPQQQPYITLPMTAWIVPKERYLKRVVFHVRAAASGSMQETFPSV